MQMEYLKIPANSLIITPTNFKRKLIKQLNKNSLKNIKVMSLTEVRKKFYFDYDERAIYYLMEKYGYLIDVAKMYLERIYEVDIESSKTQKIQKIIDLKKELIANELLTYNPNFIKLLV